MSDVEIKPGQYAVKGDKKRKVVAVNGGMVTLYNSETHTEFESKVSQLLASGYVLVDPVEDTEAASAVRSIAASSVDASTMTVPAGGDREHVDQNAAKEPDLFSVAGENNTANEEYPPEYSIPGATQTPVANVDPVPAATDVSATGQRRVRTPDEIVEDLKRRQEEDQAKMALRYKEKIFKASQRLKSLPQKRSDALAMLDGWRQSIRGSTGNHFMTDDEADGFIRKSVEDACLPVNSALLNALRPFAEGQDSNELRVEAIAAVSLAEAH